MSDVVRGLTRVSGLAACVRATSAPLVRKAGWPRIERDVPGKALRQFRARLTTKMHLVAAGVVDRLAWP